MDVNTGYNMWYSATLNLQTTGPPDGLSIIVLTRPPYVVNVNTFYLLHKNTYIKYLKKAWSIRMRTNIKDKVW